jgi:hypothetical protein
MAGRNLKLQKFELTAVNYAVLGAARLRVEASDPAGTGADPNVFLFLRGPANPADGSVVDTCIGVAGPVDMAEYPAGEPSATTAYPIYRSDAVEVDLRSYSLVERVWLALVGAVGNLLTSLDRMEALTPTDSVSVGAAADGSASASTSTSDGG